MSHSLQQNQEESASRHVVVNLDEEMAAQALSECLTLLQPLYLGQPVGLSPHQCQRLAAQLALRVSYALLQLQPRFSRSELHALASADLQRAQSLLRCQEQFQDLDSLRR